MGQRGGSMATETNNPSNGRSAPFFLSRFAPSEMSEELILEDDVEEQSEYELKEPFAHIYKRPDAYIGSVSTTERKMWIYDDKSATIIRKKIAYNPGLERIFVEIMSNAIDNLWRSKQYKEVMKYIHFYVDKDTGRVKIVNDGRAIPIVKKKFPYTDHMTNEKRSLTLYPVQAIFGYQLSGSNFKDEQERKTSGRNGIGAKAANVFSLEFIIEHTNVADSKKLMLTFTGNLEDGEYSIDRGDPDVKSFNGKKSYTSIEFFPDYARFGYPTSKIERGSNGMDDNLYALFKRHACDCAMITGLSVTFNDEKISAKTLPKYAELYFPGARIMHFTSDFGDEAVLVECLDTKDLTAKTINHVSFINGICTKNGGTHVEAWRDAIVGAIVRDYNIATRPKSRGKPKTKAKKAKEPPLASAKDVYPYFTLFVRCEVDKPSFDDQTKDCLNAPKIILAAEKTKKEWSENLHESVAKILKWEFVYLLKNKLELKAATIKIKGDKSANIAGKHTKANWAGTDKSHLCSLLISEGDSAGTMGIGGISAINAQDTMGVMCIRGKFINVRNATQKEILANKEVRLLIQVLGLEKDTDYKDETNYRALNYGRVIVFPDADDDGIHIRGLLINFFEQEYPSLLKREERFVTSLSTCVVKVNDKTEKEDLMFYSLQEFKKWESENQISWEDPKTKRRYTPSYYKGLGTFTYEEIPEFFENPKLIRYRDDNEDNEEFMNLGFGKNYSDERKEWITRDMKAPCNEDELVLDAPQEDFIYEGEMTVSYFIDKQLIIYHRMTLRRALPNIYDGFKEAHRKVFYGIYSANLKKKEKLTVLLGDIMKTTGYHHGDSSVYGTIIGMAQGFVGSNNIPLLSNQGQFGSRLLGGKDSAAPRYLYTLLEDITKAIFLDVDEPLLTYNYDDGERVEPMFYLPILPMILINGANGIACGYSSTIQCYDPLDVCKRIKQWLKNGSVTMKNAMTPWYRGFTGEINVINKKGDRYLSFESKGVLNKLKGKSKGGRRKAGEWYEITELPIGLWTNNFKSYLEYMKTGVPPAASKKPKGEKYILDYKEFNTPNTVGFHILPTSDFIPDINVASNFGCLKKKGSLANMVAIDQNDYPQTYECAEDILAAFCPFRLTYYNRRKEYLLGKYQDDRKWASNKYQYVLAVVEERLVMYQKGDEDGRLESDMEELELERKDGNYKYLLSMEMSSMREKKLESLKKQLDKIDEEIKALSSKSGADLWREDLDNFVVAYNKFLKTRSDNVVYKKRGKEGKSAFDINTEE